MQTERVGVVWKSYKLIFATCLSRISAKSSASLLASLSFFVVLLNCSRQIPGYNRFVPNHFLSIVLKSFKDEKSESNYLYKYVSIQVLIYTSTYLYKYLSIQCSLISKKILLPGRFPGFVHLSFC